MIRNASEGVIGINERNPHYFQYKGRDILLITSAEHYGAVVSRKFDYVKYFDALAEYGCNYTRIYPGAIIEPQGTWLPEDTLAPGAELIVPWARSDEPGYVGGGNKFDLSRWDGEYFIRLRDFMAEAEKRDIIVEICFFNCQNGRYWDYSPMCAEANVNGIGDCDSRVFQTLDDPALVEAQMRYIEKIIVETNEFDNAIYEFVDEPTITLTPSHKAYEWISKMADVSVATESRLPKKHMLAQQLMVGVDFCEDERFALIVTQYLSLDSRQIGGIAALHNCYCFNRPIELNETAYVPSWYDREHTAIARLEAWMFMAGGGAGFNQLNGYFLVSNPAGAHEKNHEILTVFKNLRAFLEGFDYIKMAHDNDTVRWVKPGAAYEMFSEKGRQYAMYMHHSFMNGGGFAGTYYEPNYGDYAPTVAVRLPKGEYAVTFIEPDTLRVLGELAVTSDGGDTELKCPRYTLDIAVKIVGK